MSEYQFIDFIAIDGEVSDKNLKYMRTQSTRAQITGTRFTNEYNFGDFHGDAAEMLRRGYDAHLHFANFGIRKIMFRMPVGLPWSEETFSQYAVEDCLTWDRDKRSAGGILTIEPEADAGTYEEDLYDAESFLERLAPLREMLISGDLRPLFLAWLACAYDEEAKVPPIPAGLSNLNRPLKALAEFYEIPSALIRTAAKDSPPVRDAIDKHMLIEKWAAKQNKADLQRILTQLLTGTAPDVRRKVMAEITAGPSKALWPTADSSATYGELCSAAGMSPR